jgi:hypothetical protein
LKHLDLRKITPEMRESGGGGGVKGEIKKIEDSNGKGSENGNMSTDISPDK